MAMYREARNGGAPPTNGYASDQHSVLSTGSEEIPSFPVEHLATFTVSPQTGVVYPSDGMRRLLQMEKTTGIWTQKMLLRLEHPWIVIVDHENGEVVEKFPAVLIRDPTAFTSNDPREIYNNIFIFVVAEDPVHQIPPEMHIFQCVRVSANNVVEDMKNFLTGKSKSPGNKIPPPPDNPPPEPPANGSREGSYPRGTLNDDASSTSSERYERDVTILNRCFDDIERFIARLQVAAAAGRELDRRRKSRKSKKKETGDGMLSMRARLPTEMEFIDILQKFKLSFILLAKLKQHIHDPNAPELVHFLFSPLSLIVEASQDPGFPPRLPSRVISPLLTHDAIDLLTNCLTSKETELWQSLGDPWLIPKEKWNGYVLPYVPVFMDGWSPDPSYFLDEKELKTEPKRSNPPESSRHSSDYYDSDRGASSTPLFDANRRSASPSADRRSDISVDSIEKSEKFERAQKQWFAELKARDAKIVEVTYPRTANNDKELTVIRGEYLEVLDDTRKWWKARNVKGKVGHVPNTIVTPLMMDEDDWEPNANDHQNKKVVSSNSSSSSEDSPVVLRKKNVKREPERKASTTSIPPPPPPMPKEAPKTTAAANNNTTKHASTISRTPSQQDIMYEELKSVLDQFSQRSKLDIRKTPEAFISSSASPTEVQQWLKAKEFDDSVQKRLKGMNGTEVFALKKDQLEKYFGKDEGHRLYSQLTIQRNTSGYKTTRSTELRAALERARKRAEAEEAARNAATLKTKKNYDQESD